MLLKKLIKIAQQNPDTRAYLIPLIKSAGVPGDWEVFLVEKYDGGKRKVPNPNFNTRETYPEVALSTAIKYESGGKKPVFEKVLLEYQAWREKKSGAPLEKTVKEPSEEQVAKALADVKTWSEEKKAQEFWKLPTNDDPEIPEGLINKDPRKRQSAGAVIFNEQGQILLREPSNHFGGYVWTFPKGRVDKGESISDTARREAQEETGWSTKLQSIIPKSFDGDTSATLLYLGHAESEVGGMDNETQGLKWVSLDEADKWIKKTPNMNGQKRDLSVLEEARKQRDLALAQHHAKK